MAIPVTDVKPTILAFLEQLKDAMCDARHVGIDAEIGDELDIEVTIIAPNGLNALPRVSVQEQGTREDQTINPEVSEVSTDDPVTNITTQESSESATVQLRTEPEQLTTRNSQPKTTITTRSSTPSTSETREDQSSTQSGFRQSSGGNETNDYYTYDI